MSKNKLDFTLMHVKAKIVLLPPGMSKSDVV